MDSEWYQINFSSANAMMCTVGPSGAALHFVRCLSCLPIWVSPALLEPSNAKAKRSVACNAESNSHPCLKLPKNAWQNKVDQHSLLLGTQRLLFKLPRNKDLPIARQQELYDQSPAHGEQNPKARPKRKVGIGKSYLLPCPSQVPNTSMLQEGLEQILHQGQKGAR